MLGMTFDGTSGESDDRIGGVAERAEASPEALRRLHRALFGKEAA